MGGWRRRKFFTFTMSTQFFSFFSSCVRAQKTRRSQNETNHSSRKQRDELQVKIVENFIFRWLSFSFSSLFWWDFSLQLRFLLFSHRHLRRPMMILTKTRPFSTYHFTVGTHMSSLTLSACTLCDECGRLEIHQRPKCLHVIETHQLNQRNVNTCWKSSKFRAAVCERDVLQLHNNSQTSITFISSVDASRYFSVFRNTYESRGFFSLHWKKVFQTHIWAMKTVVVVSSNAAVWTKQNKKYSRELERS